MVEHRIPNPGVGGSNPSRPAIIIQKSREMIEKINLYLTEVKQELSKVSWPEKDELLNSTYIVMAVSAGLALFIFGVDSILTAIMKFFLQ